MDFEDSPLVLPPYRFSIQEFVKPVVQIYYVIVTCLTSRCSLTYHNLRVRSFFFYGFDHCCYGLGNWMQQRQLNHARGYQSQPLLPRK